MYDQELTKDEILAIAKDNLAMRSDDAVKEEFAVIIYDGKNYLCRTLYDYDKKIYNGISIACYEGRPIMMWVEPFTEKNIVNVISLTGLHDFEITGFLINSSEYTSIYCITAEVTYGASEEIYTQMYRVNL